MGLVCAAQRHQSSANAHGGLDAIASEQDAAFNLSSPPCTLPSAHRFNEGPSNQPDACPAYKANADLAKARDPTRFTTWADDWTTGGYCYEHASLIAFNNYPGW